MTDADLQAIAPSIWRIGGDLTLPLERLRIMAILNVTPDSFFDGGQHNSLDAALSFARQAVRSGADIIDVGPESTRPGAEPVDAAEQIRRAVPVICALRADGITLPISIDTSRADVAHAALDVGAEIINDVSAGTDDPDMLPLAADRGIGLVLMHRLCRPKVDRYSTRYGDEAPDYTQKHGGVVGAVRDFLRSRIDASLAAGVEMQRLVLDPGLGFGKNVEQNITLIRELGRLQHELGTPMLSAASRKSFLGTSSENDSPTVRQSASVAVTVYHALSGIRLFRVHDVAEHARALATVSQLVGAKSAAQVLRPATLG